MRPPGRSSRSRIDLRRSATTAAAAMLLMLIGVGGCKSDNPYVPPDLPASEVATLKGVGATLISSVDGKEVEQGYVIGVFGSGNQTTVTPGRHAVGVAYFFGNSERSYMTLLDVARATTYTFFTKNFGRHLVVKNEATGNAWTYDADTLSVFDSAGKPYPVETVIAP